MMKSKSSVSSRFAITAIFNAGKVTLAFLTGTVIARVLGPKQCGDYMFLLGSFLGIRQLLNLETSAAFYTFLCQKPRSSKFILSYIAWQLLQLTITILIIEFILPDSIIEQIWIQQDRKHILIALLGVFFMQQISLTVTQIGESLRKTQRTQALSFFMNLLQFISILLLSISGHLSISSIFTSMSIIAALSFLVSFIMIPIPLVKEMPSVSISEMVEQYTKYCSPLIINAGLTFIYIFSDKWLLQKYGGSREQAFYSVSYQLAAIGFFAAEAATNIFWKEIAEAYQLKDMQRFSEIYTKITRFLFMVSSALCAFLLPWSREIILIVLGPAYLDGWPILAIISIYPIHQSINHITSTVFYTTGRTKEFATYGVIFMLTSIIISYFVQAPATNFIPGLGMSGIGMAVKMVSLNTLSALALSYWLLKIFKLRFDIKHQLKVSIFCFGWGFAVINVIKSIMPNSPSITVIFFMILISAILYFSGLVLIFWKHPSYFGFTKNELYEILGSIYPSLLTKFK